MHLPAHRDSGTPICLADSGKKKEATARPRHTEMARRRPLSVFSLISSLGRGKEKKRFRRKNVAGKCLEKRRGGDFQRGGSKIRGMSAKPLREKRRRKERGPGFRPA